MHAAALAELPDSRGCLQHRSAELLMRSMRLGSRSIASGLALTSSPGRKPILNKLVIRSPSRPTGSCQIASRSEAETFESVRQFREAVEQGVGGQGVGVDP